MLQPQYHRLLNLIFIIPFTVLLDIWHVKVLISHFFLIKLHLFLSPKTWVTLVCQVNQISGSGWLFLFTLPSRQAFDKNCSMGWLCLQRKYVGKPGERVTKALFQKDRSRKWRIWIPRPGNRMPLGQGTTDACGKMGLDSWILLPKQSFSVFGTQARPQADTPCFVALECLTKFNTALPVINTNFGQKPEYDYHKHLLQ